MSQRLTKRQIENRLEAEFRSAIVGIPINIMDLGKVHTFGMALIAAGETGEPLARAIRDYVAGLSK